MMSLPDPSLEEEAIPEFLASLSQSNPLLLLHPYSNFVSGGCAGRCSRGLGFCHSDAVTDELVDILVDLPRDLSASAILKAMISLNLAPSVKVVLAKPKDSYAPNLGQQDRMVPSPASPVRLPSNPNLQLLGLDNAGTLSSR